jgi:hypothetical protein
MSLLFYMKKMNPIQNFKTYYLLFSSSSSFPFYTGHWALVYAKYSKFSVP